MIHYFHFAAGFCHFILGKALTLCEPLRADYHFCISSAINAGIDTLGEVVEFCLRKLKLSFHVSSTLVFVSIQLMVPFGYEKYLEDLTQLVESKEISLSRVDNAVEQILRVKFVAGLFEHPYSDMSLLDTVGCKLHRELAQEAVRKSSVLLKNGKDYSKPLLPFDRNAKRILITGTHADNLGFQCGGWTITWGGLSGRITIGYTILDAIKEVVSDDTQVIYEEFPSPETLEKESFSYAVVSVGEAPYVEFTCDNTVLNIPFNGVDLISAVADKFPTLVILVSGRPLVLEPWLLQKIDALVAAFLP